MSQALAIRLTPETVRSLAFGSIGAAYIGVGTSMTNPIRILILQNMTDVDLMFSFDGINDHLPIPTTGQLVLDITANKTITQGFFLAEGQRIYVKQISGAPASGSVYVSAFYGHEV